LTTTELQRFVVARADELPPGTSRIVEVGGRSIGVIRTNEGRLYALRNACPHHGAPLCLGEVTGMMLPSGPHEYRYDDEQTVMRCPWHGYPFRLDDGHCATRPELMRVKTYRVEIENAEVVLYA
jgi:3-phenylpropionate/trans-cinnamate dioxygenase ferredoxin subunit